MKLAPYQFLSAIALLASSACSSGSSGSSGQASGTVSTIPGTDPALTVTVTPTDAQIVVRSSDGRIAAIPRSGARVPAASGPYSVAVHRVRFRSAQQQVSVNGDTTLAVALQPETPVQPLACGPLRVSAANPRYFADACRTRYLAGIHTWNNLIDMGVTQPPRAFDFAAFLGFLGARGVNATRLYAWEVPHPNDSNPSNRDWTAPQVWLRKGPGVAVDGLPKFDLSVLDESYFVRMRERVRAMQDAGIYVMVMLFEGWSVQRSPGAGSHPFAQSNNVNGIDPGDVRRIDTLDDPAITDIQEDYARKVVDTVYDLDNVLYEIANEAVPDSVSWQYHMIEFVKSYERAKPKQHTVGMTWPLNGDNADLFASPADWVAPAGEEPEFAAGDKIVVSDNDHLGGSHSGDEAWVWRRFLAGAHTLFMDCYVAPDGLCGDSTYAPAAEIRRALGATRRYADRMDLASVVPRPDRASTGHCLASARQLIAFDPEGGSITVTVPGGAAQFQAEWYEPATDRVYPRNAVSGGTQQTVTAPFSGPAVLFLWAP